MAHSGKVYANIQKGTDIKYPLLVPNLKGLESASETNVKEIAIFAAASEGFSKKNINCSIAESMERFRKVVQQAKSQNMWVRGYVSCIVGCPYDGWIQPSAVVRVVEELVDAGCDEISLGDTIGVGTPAKIQQLLKAVKTVISEDRLAIHCHDTYGQAIANIWVSLEEGIRRIDTSVAGLGGCPYAKGATGNVSTEDVHYLLEQTGMKTGLEMESVGAASDFILSKLERQSRSKVGQVRLNKQKD